MKTKYDKDTVYAVAYRSSEHRKKFFHHMISMLRPDPMSADKWTIETVYQLLTLHYDVESIHRAHGRFLNYIVNIDPSALKFFKITEKES